MHAGPTARAGPLRQLRRWTETAHRTNQLIRMFARERVEAELRQRVSAGLPCTRTSTGFDRLGQASRMRSTCSTGSGWIERRGAPHPRSPGLAPIQETAWRRL